MPFVGSDQTSGHGILVRAGFRIWRGKMPWGRRDALPTGYERRAMGGNGFVSDGGKDSPSTSTSSSSSQDVNNNVG